MGSEMCIRDRHLTGEVALWQTHLKCVERLPSWKGPPVFFLANHLCTAFQLTSAGSQEMVRSMMVFNDRGLETVLQRLKQNAAQKATGVIFAISKLTSTLICVIDSSSDHSPIASILSEPGGMASTFVFEAGMESESEAILTGEVYNPFGGGFYAAAYDGVVGVPYGYEAPYDAAWGAPFADYPAFF